MAPLCSVVPVRAGSIYFPSCLAVPAHRRVPLSVVVLLLPLMFAPQAGLAASPPPLWECIAGPGGSVTVASNLQSANECIEPLKAYVKNHIVPRICAPYITSGYQVNDVWLHWQEKMPDGQQVHYLFEAALLIFNPAGRPMGCVEDYFAVARIQKCPVPPLTPFPPAGDLCAASLEAGKGQDVNNSCPPLDPRMQEAKACLDTKIAYALGGSVSTVPEATIRTVAYQNHLLDIYQKWLDLINLKKPEDKKACAALKSKVDIEKKTHGIAYRPSALGADAPHVLGLAVDMNENMLYNMASIMAPMDGAGGINLTDYLRNPVGTTQGCKLCWGGTFQPSDPVHIQYCP